jgi:hypothetical protein
MLYECSADVPLLTNFSLLGRNHPYAQSDDEDVH